MPNNLPSIDALRPRRDALTRQELADALDEPYTRVYWWTARRDPPIVRPTYGHSDGKGDPAWFSPADLEQLREFFAALNTVQRFTGSRTPRNARARQAGGS